MAKKQNNETKETNHGYYMYSDGSTFWGVGVIRGSEIPVQITAVLHNASIEDRLKWFGEEAAKLEVARKEQEAMEKVEKSAVKKGKKQ